MPEGPEVGGRRAELQARRLRDAFLRVGVHEAQDAVRLRITHDRVGLADAAVFDDLDAEHVHGLFLDEVPGLRQRVHGFVGREPQPSRAAYFREAVDVVRWDGLFQQRKAAILHKPGETYGPEHVPALVRVRNEGVVRADGLPDRADARRILLHGSRRHFDHQGCEALPLHGGGLLGVGLRGIHAHCPHNWKPFMHRAAQHVRDPQAAAFAEQIIAGQIDGRLGHAPA